MAFNLLYTRERNQENLEIFFYYHCIRNSIIDMTILSRLPVFKVVHEGQNIAFAF